MKKNTVRTSITIIAALFIIVWGVSHAASTPTSSEQANSVQNYSILGTVTAISQSDKTVSLIGTGGASVTLDLSTAEKIETNHYEPLSLADIQTNDKVIFQGIQDAGAIIIKRIIDFSWKGQHAYAATSTATTTATSTDVASTTSEVVLITSDLSSTTPDNSSIVSSTTDQTSTTTDDTASPTDSDATTTNESNTSTTDSTAPTTDVSPPTQTADPLIDSGDSSPDANASPAGSTE